MKPNEATIPEGSECEVGLDKSFGFSKQFVAHYELGQEVGRGHFGYTCSAKGKKGSFKGHDVAVKVIPKSKVSLLIGSFYTCFSLIFGFFFKMFCFELGCVLVTGMIMMMSDLCVFL